VDCRGHVVDLHLLADREHTLGDELSGVGADNRRTQQAARAIGDELREALGFALGARTIDLREREAIDAIVDAVAARYALNIVGGVNILGITNVDRLVSLPMMKAACTYGPEVSFPSGGIPIIAPDLYALRARTGSLAEAVPQYAPLPSISSASTAHYLKYVAALGEMIGHQIDMISATAGEPKIYPTTEARPKC